MCKRLQEYDVHNHTPFSLYAAFQTLIPTPDTCIIQNFTALSGDRFLLPCPIQPGALLQYYSVVWRKDSTMIAQAMNPHEDVEKTDSRYDIDRATYALIIDPVSVNDTSANYQCQVSVQNPMTRAKLPLQYNSQQTSGVSLSLTALGKLISVFLHAKVV